MYNKDGKHADGKILKNLCSFSRMELCFSQETEFPYYTAVNVYTKSYVYICMKYIQAMLLVGKKYSNSNIHMSYINVKLRMNCIKTSWPWCYLVNTRLVAVVSVQLAGRHDRIGVLL